jgi:hypothetical protein
LPKGLKTAWWLIKITVPVSFVVMLLDYFGLLARIAFYTTPLFNLLGLPGVSAVVFITSLFTNVYSVVALLALFDFPFREGTILAAMCLVSHGFLIETAVLKRTGSSPVRMLMLRIISSFLIAWMLNALMPGSISTEPIAVSSAAQPFGKILWQWFLSISETVTKILLLVNLLLIFQQIMEEFGWVNLINKPLAPLMKILGLPQNTTLSWVVANLIGLGYGSAIMIDQRDKGRMSRQEADLLNHHVAVSHSQLEDPLLFVSLGYAMHWLMWPRVVIALLTVWERRLELLIKSKRSV